LFLTEQNFANRQTKDLDILLGGMVVIWVKEIGLQANGMQPTLFVFGREVLTAVVMKSYIPEDRTFHHCFLINSIDINKADIRKRKVFNEK
jgi:hypothetical protein